MTNNFPLGIVITADTRAALQRAAGDRQISIADYVASLVADALDHGGYLAHEQDRRATTRYGRSR